MRENKHSTVVIEMAALESRRLLSIVIDPNAHLATVTTGSGNDNIFISQNFNDVKFVINGVTTVKSLLGGFFNQIVINAGGGNDNIECDLSLDPRCSINGQGGDDKIQSYGSGGDDLDGGSGVDTISYEKLATTAYITPDGVRNDGNQVNNDNVHANFERFVGGSSGDQIFVAEIANATVFGGKGNDTITGGISGDVFGEGGDDLLLATDSTGANNFSGGPGKDTITYTGRSNHLALSLDGSHNDGETGEGDFLSHDIEVVVGGRGNDTITGDQFDNVLDGFSGNDLLIGNAGKDTLNGSIGNDTMRPGLGDDVINGGSGSDLVSYADRSTPLTIKLNGLAESGEAGEHDKIGTDVEKAFGGSSNDTFYGNDLANTFFGNNGRDVFFSSKGGDTYFGGAGFDTVSYENAPSGVNVTIDGLKNDGISGSDNVTTDIETVMGSDFNDSLTGDGDNNLLIGRKGNDKLFGQGGDDSLDGGEGADLFDGGSGFDQAVYGYRTDDLKLTVDDGANDGAAGEGDEILSTIEDLEAGSGNDFLKGDNGGAVVAGNGGNDTMVGGTGPDIFFGGDGIDLVDYSARTEDLTLDMNSGFGSGAAGENDRILNTIENLISGSGNDTINGNSLPNSISGGGGNDLIDGKAGNDTIHGGGGKDTITGGAGQDKLFGDSNNDKFHAQDGEIDTVTGGSGTDSILDKDSNDVLSGVP